MKLLLDTHALLWAIDRPAELSPAVRTALLDETNVLTVSVASLWEIGLKAQAGKLKVPIAAEYWEEHGRRLGVTRYLPISLFHVHQSAQLPPIHRDPFDRMLVAQALAEGLTLVSKDGVLPEYGVPVLW